MSTIIGIKISNCDNCPCCYYNEKGVGYYCGLQEKLRDRGIAQTSSNGEIGEIYIGKEPSPNWCPLRQSPIELKHEDFKLTGPNQS